MTNSVQMSLVDLFSAPQNFRELRRCHSEGEKNNSAND